MQYERRRFTKAVGEDDPAQVLPKTKLWLRSGFRKVAPLLYGRLNSVICDAGMTPWLILGF